MHDSLFDPNRARRLGLGCDTADAALVALERTTSPAIWTGPAAGSYAVLVEVRAVRIRAALGLAREAAVALVAAPGGG